MMIKRYIRGKKRVRITEEQYKKDFVRRATVTKLNEVARKEMEKKRQKRLCDFFN